MVDYDYYKNESGSVYRTKLTRFNTGEIGLSVERWNWDEKNWGGHIHDHETTRKNIAQLSGGFDKITKTEALGLLK